MDLTSLAVNINQGRTNMSDKEAIKILIADMFCNNEATFCSDCREFLNTGEECLFGNESSVGLVADAGNVLRERKIRMKKEAVYEREKN